MTAMEHYRAGKLSQALAAASQEVKSKPADASARGFLCEMLCFNGDTDRADAQLDAIAQLDPKNALSISLFRHLLRAEQARAQFYRDGRVPEFLKEPSDELKMRLQASIAIREGRHEEAAELTSLAETRRPHLSGQCQVGEEEIAFDDVRDLDDFTSSFLEVLTTNGKYYWVPFSEVELIEFHPPVRARDLLWRRTHLIVRGGPDGEVYVPALYSGSHAADNEQVRLGRATEWINVGSNLVRGIGQRVFLIGEQDRSIMEMTSIQLETSDALSPT